MSAFGNAESSCEGLKWGAFETPQHVVTFRQTLEPENGLDIPVMAQIIVIAVAWRSNSPAA